MATNTAGSVARELSFQAVHYLRKDFTFADAGDTLTVGTIPAGSLILKPASGVMVTVAFNGGGTDLLDIGKSGSAEFFASDLDLSSAGFVTVDVNTDLKVSVDTTIIATYTDANGDSSAGTGYIVIAYCPNI